jgi:hypothetical protein
MARAAAAIFSMTCSKFFSLLLTASYYRIVVRKSRPSGSPMVIFSRRASELHEPTERDPEHMPTALCWLLMVSGSAPSDNLANTDPA